MLSQGWEIRGSYVKKGTGKLIGLKKCKALAKKQVSNGKIVSAVRKRSKGIELYDIKMQKSSKKYELKYHARTGKLLEYEWELMAKPNKKKEYISEGQAQQAALTAAGGGMVVKIKLDTDDGVKVYEAEVLNGDYEFHVDILAANGEVVKVEKEFAKPGPGSGDGQTQPG